MPVDQFQAWLAMNSAQQRHLGFQIADFTAIAATWIAGCRLDIGHSLWAFREAKHRHDIARPELRVSTLLKSEIAPWYLRVRHTSVGCVYGCDWGKFRCAFHLFWLASIRRMMQSFPENNISDL
jgi:hypothetical protein